MSVEKGGCPKCDSTMVEGQSFDVEGNYVYQELLCNDCGCAYVDEYKLFSQIIEEDK